MRSHMPMALATHRAEAHPFQSQDPRFRGGKMHRITLTLSLSLAVVGSVACASDSKSESTRLTQPLSGPGAGNDDGGDHGADQPWVDCRNRKHQRAADPFGPVISHGVREAPGFRRGRFGAKARRAFRRASLQMGFPRPGFLLTDIQLPSTDVSEPQVARLVMSAIALADLEAPAAPQVTARRQLGSDGNAHTLWDIGFFHQQVPLSPGRCQLSVQTGEASGARLFCRLPDETPLRFDAFNVAEDTALESAKLAAEIDTSQATISARYEARGARAVARFYAILSDGRNELIVHIDGNGEVLSVGSNERAFTFAGYDLDYLSGFKPAITAPVPVGLGFPEVLDTMGHVDGLTSCKRFGGEQPQRGFAVCHNDILRSPGSGNPYLQPVVAPRSDDDFTNPAGAPASFPDPLPPQDWVFSDSFPGGAPMHSTLTDVTGFPLGDEFLLYLRADPSQLQQQPYGPAHHAELQMFSNAGQRQRYYSFLDLRFSPGNQDRFRTELTAHWNRSFEGSGQRFNRGGRAGRFIVKVSDVRPTQFGQPVGDVAFDGSVDGSLFAHEYHHHIQESLFEDENWTPFNGVEVLFPFMNVDCSPEPECRRRVRILEGTADGFGALAVGRGAIGTSYAWDQSLEQLGAVCASREGYGPMQLAPGTRAVCNNRTFGMWDDPDATCGAADEQFGLARQGVVSGAMYLFQRRLLQGGVTKTLAGLPLLEAERALQQLTDGELDYYQQLLVYLSAQPADTVRRYQYAARAAFVEKGVFSPSLHFINVFFGGDIDDRLDVRCDAPACNASSALQLSSLSLTLSGPLNWDDDPDDPGAQMPVFDGFAPPGSAYNNTFLPPGAPPQTLTWLELSDNPGFNGQTGFFGRTQLLSDPMARLNCAPNGFFRPTAPQQGFRDAVRVAAQSSGRVYYRLRQCLAGSGPDDAGACVVSTQGATPAFMTVQLAPPGCSCRMPGARVSTQWSWLLLGLALGLRRRKRR